MKKRRFAEGGFSDIDEGRDTPDQALARKASMSSLASSDKAAGLASTKGQDVGFFKRLSMGNIDAPGSEASNSFGAGKGSSDRMAQAADQNLPVRPNPRPPFNIPSTPIDVAESPMISGTPTGPSGYKRDTAREDALTLDRESVRKTPTNASAKPIAKPPIRRPVKDPTAEKGMSRGRPGSISDSDKPKPPAGSMRGYGEIANLDSRAVRDRKTAQMMMSQDEKLRKKRAAERLGVDTYGMKKGGSIKAYASGGSVSSRGDGIAQRGKTRGMMR